MVVFSEMCIPGYIIGDAWEVEALVEDFAAYSDSVCQQSSGIAVLFGNVAVDRQQIGEDGRLRKFNLRLRLRRRPLPGTSRAATGPAGGDSGQEPASQLPVLRRRPPLLFPAQAGPIPRSFTPRLDGSVRDAVARRWALSVRRSALRRYLVPGLLRRTRQAGYAPVVSPAGGTGRFQPFGIPMDVAEERETQSRRQRDSGSFADSVLLRQSGGRTEQWQECHGLRRRHHSL